MIQSVRNLTLLVALLCVSGCQTMTGGSACDGWKPIRPTTKDVGLISSQLVTDLLEHNEHGKNVCGWKRSAE